RREFATEDVVDDDVRQDCGGRVDDDAGEVCSLEPGKLVGRRDERDDRSVADLGALRMRVDGFDAGDLPAAGTPWFMTVFGRDTLITCLQTLTFGPDLAASALRVLAATQANFDDPERDAEPGKIIHEMRRGKAALAWTDRYYGTVDATPLFLVLLSELWRWTNDSTIASELEEPARRALAWIDGPAD